MISPVPASPACSPRCIAGTGFASVFTHQQTDLPADHPRVVLTGVLAEATNLGLSRMADACSVTSRRKLAWTAGWHLREETYRSALKQLCWSTHNSVSFTRRLVRSGRRIEL